MTTPLAECCKFPNLRQASAMVDFLRFPLTYCEHCRDVEATMSRLGEVLFRALAWLTMWDGRIVVYGDDGCTRGWWERLMGAKA